MYWGGTVIKKIIQAKNKNFNKYKKILPWASKKTYFTLIFIKIYSMLVS